MFLPKAPKYPLRWYPTPARKWWQFRHPLPQAWPVPTPGDQTANPDQAILTLSVGTPAPTTGAVDAAPDTAVLSGVGISPAPTLGAVSAAPDTAILTAVGVSPTPTTGAVSAAPSTAILALAVQTPAAEAIPLGLNQKIEVDWNDDGDWSDTNEDLTPWALTWETTRGRSTPSLVPDVGDVPAARLTVTLDNHDGRWSVLNPASPLYGTVAQGHLIRVRLTGAVNANIFVGIVDDIAPDAVSVGSLPQATLTAYGMLVKLYSADKVSLAPQTAVQSGTVMDALLNAGGIEPAWRNVEAGELYLPVWYAFDITPGDAARDLNDSELGMLFEDKDGVVQWHDRHHRHTATRSRVVQFDASDLVASDLDFDEVSQAAPLEGIINSVTVTATTYDLTAGNETLWEQPANIYGIAHNWEAIQPGAYLQWVAEPPSDVLFVLSWEDPVILPANVSPRADTLASLDVATSVPAGSPLVLASARNRVLKVTNTGDYIAYVRNLTLSGVPVREAQSESVMAFDSASVTRYGPRPLSSDVRVAWLGDRVRAQDYADHLVHQFKDAQPAVTLSFLATGDTATAAVAFGAEIADRISLDLTGASMLGLSGEYMIESIQFRCDGYHIRGSVGLSPAKPAAWRLGVSALGTDTRLVY